MLALFMMVDFSVSSPIDGALLARLEQVDKVEAMEAIAAAHRAFRHWRGVPAPRRGELVRLLGEELRNAKEDLGRLVTIETGKIRPRGRAKFRK